MRKNSQIDISNQFVFLKCLIEHGRLLLIWRLEKVPDKTEIFAFDVLDEVVSEVLEEGLVEAKTPEEVSVKAPHRDGAAKPLN